MEVPAYRTISPNKDEHLCGAFRTQWLLLAVTTATRAHNVTEYHESESEVAQSATPWTVAYQTPLSMGFSRQGYWSGLPFSSPGDLPYPEIKPRSLALQADSLLTELPRKPPFGVSWPKLAMFVHPLANPFYVCLQIACLVLVMLLQ